MMERSESIKELATALSKAQGEFLGAVKDTANPFFKSLYANLESVITSIRPHLAKHGLSYVQISHQVTGMAAIETVILHSSGEWLSAGIVSAPASKQDAQGYGSAMTYVKRYGLSAAFGVATEDDDANAASKVPPLPAKQAAKQAAKPVSSKDFTGDIENLKECNTEVALGVVWNKFDAPTKHALESVKNECKIAIAAAASQ